MKSTLLAAVTAATLAASAGAQVIDFQDFEGSGDFGGWHVNGNQMIFGGGNPGNYMGVPYMDFWGITLSNASETSPVNTDYTQLGGPVQFSVDVSVFALDNFFGDAMDPSEWPLVLQLHDHGDPNNFDDDVSVWTAANTLPKQSDGWTRLEYLLPDPNGSDIPDGWGGTGAWDDLGNPILPPDRSWSDVLASIDEVSFTTFVPGYFYSANFWEVGFDNVSVEVVPAPGALALLGAAGLCSRRRRRD
jgi:MYXO-CTERM domain-containing protein